MKSFLKNYVSEFEKELNIPLMNKEADIPLIDYIIDCWKSLEIVENIKILSWHYDPDESKIDINDYMLKRVKKKKKKDRVKLKFINDDRYGSLTVKIEISIWTPPKSDGTVELQKTIITKKILIPVQDDEGFFQIKGKKYYMIYQLVDKSTYTTSNGITQKSLMGISIKRETISRKDINGVPYTIPLYKINKFAKDIEVILFYATEGLRGALSYLGVNGIIKFSDKPVGYNEDDRNLYFPISSKVNIVVNKFMYDKYIYVQSIVGMILSVTTNRFTMEDIDDKEYWLKKLGNNKVEKGKSDKVFFNRMLDETTKKILMSHDYNKKNIYALIRWMMQNYNELRLKDNLSLDNKRLRCNELIATLLTKEFSKRLNRILSLGNKASLNDFKDIFKFPGDILMQQMHSSGILRYDENINDMDFFTKFKITSKGPNSMGNKNDNNIGIKYRGIHPSFLGHIDILVCGNSDPGTSGLLSPYSKINGLYFNDKNEPDDFIIGFNQDLRTILSEDGVDFIDIELENKEDYFTMINKLDDFGKGNFKVYGTSKNKYIITVEEFNIDNADDDEEDKNIDKSTIF